MTQQLDAAMRERYGLDRNPWPARIIVGAVVVIYVGLLIFFGARLTTDPIDARLLLWQQPQPDRVDLLFEVNKPTDQAVTCVLRGQDSDRIDVGYATVEVPAGQGYVQQEYQLRVIAPASLIELLACGPAGEPLRVPPAAFPPGIVPPEQPWQSE